MQQTPLLPSQSYQKKWILTLAPSQLLKYNLQHVHSETLRNKKCPGLDGIPPQLLKLADIQDIILPILYQALDNGHTPHQWRHSGLLPFFKKGDRSCFANYRGISLMSLVGKLYNRVLLNRIRGKIEPLLHYNQESFRPGQSIVQHVLSLCRILEQC